MDLLGPPPRGEIDLAEEGSHDGDSGSEVQVEVKSAKFNTVPNWLQTHRPNARPQPESIDFVVLFCVKVAKLDTLTNSHIGPGDSSPTVYILMCSLFEGCQIQEYCSNHLSLCNRSRTNLSLRT